MIERPNWFEASQLARYTQEPPTPKEQQRYNAYIEAMKRIAARLLARAMPKDPTAVRGRAKTLAKTPEQRSLTLKRYMAIFECFMLWNKIVNGRELLPHEITVAMAHDYCRWLLSSDPPDIRIEKLRIYKPTLFQAYHAIQKFNEQDIKPTIPQIWKELYPNKELTETAMKEYYDQIQHGCRIWVLQKDPDAVTLAAAGIISRYPVQNYKWTAVPRSPVMVGTVAAHVRYLSAVWNEMLQGENYEGGEAPLKYNIWREATKIWDPKARDEAKRKAQKHRITKEIYEALEWAAYARAGSTDDFEVEDLPPTFEGKRDLLILVMLAHLGLRVEELCGILRKDIEVDGDSYILTIYGKGDSVRKVRFGTHVRDVFLSMNTVIEYIVKHGNEARAAYAKQLLSPDAPVIPATVRWGQACSVRFKKELVCNPKLPMSRSGIQLVLIKLSETARVRDIRTGQTRPLTQDEKLACHPHAFRHFYATMAISGGMNPIEVQRVLGHNTFTTTQGYLDMQAEEVGDATLAVQRAMKGQKLTPEDRESMSQAVKPVIEAAKPVIPAGSVRASAKIQKTQQVVEFPKGEELKRPAAKPKSAEVKKVPEAKVEQLLLDMPDIEPEEIEPALEQADVVAVKGVESEPPPAASERSAWADESFGLYRATGSRPGIEFFVRGNLSGRPWWRGPVGDWGPDKRLPILSRWQANPESAIKSGVLEALEKLYFRFMSAKGPTASAALLKWVGYLLGDLAPTLQIVMLEKKAQWVAFEADDVQMPDLREHDVGTLVQWFERYGDQVTSTAAGALQMPGERTFQPPEWYFELDPILTLPVDERIQLQEWIEKLQGVRSSKRQIGVVSTLVTLVQDYADALSAERSMKTGRRRLRMKDILDVYPEGIRELGRESFHFDIDVSEILRMDADGVHAKVIAYLKKHGLQYVEDIEVLPAVDDPGGLFEPAQIQFNESHTIEHSEEYKTAFFDRTGQDSECVVRRIVRAMWEDRKEHKSNRKDRILPRYNSLLATIIPCPTAIEDSLRKRGVNMDRFREAWKMAALWEEFMAAPEQRRQEIQALEEDFADVRDRAAQFTVAAEGHVETTGRKFAQNASELGVPNPVRLVFATYWDV